MRRKTNASRAVAAVAVAVAAVLAVPATAGADAPPQRGYELVGPRGSGDTSVGGFAAQPDGEAIYWMAPGGEQATDPAPSDGAHSDVLLARRGSDGWTSRWLTPDPAGRPNGDASVSLPGMRTDGVVFLSSGYWATPGDWTSMVPALFQVDGGAPTLLSAAPGTVEQAGLDEFQWTTSEDLSSTVFATTAKLIPTDTDESADIYVQRGGTLALVSTRTDGTADNTEATPFLPAAASGTADGTSADGALQYTEQSVTGFPVSQGGSPVSPDGRSIVFSTTAQLDPTDTDSASDLYLWREGQGVTLISDDERQVPGCPGVAGSTTDCTGPAADVSFVGMSEDASIIYLRTREGLVDGDTDGGNDIYEYRVGAPSGQRLTLASGDGTGNAVWPVSVSADGRLFFAATDRVGVDPPTGVGVVLYRWDGTTIGTVSTLTDADVFTPTGDMRQWGIASTYPAQRAVRATADGSALLFQTTGALDPADTDTAADLYLWRSGQGVELVSGTGPAAVPLGTSSRGPNVEDPNIPRYPAYGGGRVISADASRVFFTSTDALTADAGDNGRPKLYEWHQGSDLTLVSPPGAAAHTVTYIDNGVSGTDAFFMTADSLVGADTDGGAIDTYDARLGGGFPEPPPPPGPCRGEDCQGPPAPPPSLPTTGSASFVGGGNVPPVPGRASVGVAKTKAVTGNAARLKVWAPGAGRITVAGSQIRRFDTSVPKAGIYPVRVTLSPAAQKSLRTKKSLRVKARVSYRAKDGRTASKAVSITFRQPNAQRPRSKSTTTRKGH